MVIFANLKVNVPSEEAIARFHKETNFRERAIFFIVHLQDYVLVGRPILCIWRITRPPNEGMLVKGCIVPRSGGSAQLSACRPKLATSTA